MILLYSDWRPLLVTLVLHHCVVMMSFLHRSNHLHHLVCFYVGLLGLFVAFFNVPPFVIVNL